MPLLIDRDQRTRAGQLWRMLQQLAAARAALAACRAAMDRWDKSTDTDAASINLAADIGTALAGSEGG